MGRPRALSCAPASRQAALNLLLEQPDKRRRHVFVPVRNAEDHDALAAQLRLELGGDLGPMRRLPDEYRVRPGGELSRDLAARVAPGTGRRRLDARPVREHLLCSTAEKTVLATDKEHVVRQSITCDLTPECGPTRLVPLR